MPLTVLGLSGALNHDPSAALYVDGALVVAVEKMDHVYLGPAYTSTEIITACDQHPGKPRWRRLDNVAAEKARLLVEGNPMAWYLIPRSIAGARPWCAHLQMHWRCFLDRIFNTW